MQLELVLLILEWVRIWMIVMKRRKRFSRRTPWHLRRVPAVQAMKTLPVKAKESLRSPCSPKWLPSSNRSLVGALLLLGR